MAELIKVTIDGVETRVPFDTPLIEACRQAGARVPTLCYNENVRAYGVCRICLVEANEGRRTRLVASCVYPVRRELAVQTNTEKLRKIRAMLIGLQLARCPNEKVLLDLAAEYGVSEPHPRLTRDKEDCILCGLCVRTCQDVVGVAAIAFEGRGAKRRVVAPFDAENPMCIACGACAYICPTQCIGFRDENGKRYVDKWHREVDMLVCEKCGDYWLPDPFASVYAKKMGIDPATFKVCPNCR